MMKRKQPAALNPGLSHVKTQSHPIVAPGTELVPVLLKGFYLERMEELQTSLKQLNLLDHARQISNLCREIVRVQKTLVRLSIYP